MKNSSAAAVIVITFEPRALLYDKQEYHDQMLHLTFLNGNDIILRTTREFQDLTCGFGKRPDTAISPLQPYPQSNI